MSQFSSGAHDGPLTNPKSWGLHDARQYRWERMVMNNPKGWAHVLRVFQRAVGAGFYADYRDHDEMVTHALAVV